MSPCLYFTFPSKSDNIKSNGVQQQQHDLGREGLCKTGNAASKLAPKNEMSFFHKWGRD